MCVLAPADFQAQGLPAHAVQANISDGGASAYCTYTGVSAAQGGVELDVFVLPTPGDAVGTENTAAGEAAQTLLPFPLPGVDAARWDPQAKSGGPTFASLLVRRGTVVFVLGIPSSPDVQAKLTALANLVLARL
jgi:hypothetical protein